MKGKKRDTEMANKKFQAWYLPTREKNLDILLNSDNFEKKKEALQEIIRADFYKSTRSPLFLKRWHPMSINVFGAHWIVKNKNTIPIPDDVFDYFDSYYEQVRRYNFVNNTTRIIHPCVKENGEWDYEFCARKACGWCKSKKYFTPFKSMTLKRRGRKIKGMLCKICKPKKNGLDGDLLKP